MVNVDPNSSKRHSEKMFEPNSAHKLVTYKSLDSLKSEDMSPFGSNFANSRECIGDILQKRNKYTVNDILSPSDNSLAKKPVLSKKIIRLPDKHISPIFKLHDLSKDSMIEESLTQSTPKYIQKVALKRTLIDPGAI